MVKKLTALFFGILFVAIGGQASAGGFSISVGTDDFYVSVGNYDYYQYSLPSYQQPPRISFYDVMSDYGSWVWIQPFGQVWRPYVNAGWRPYVYGHWVYTRYGPTWVGYEPWAWVGYHYGNWIWDMRNGWVWIPGYDWHPGHVIWSHGYDSIGWMPAPPQGYDYSRGYLTYRGSHNQFDYDDNDFQDYNGYYGDPYENSGYRDLYYGPEYRNIAINLWVFIDVNHYDSPNYGDYYLDSDYTRTLFDRRLVRISSRPIERPTMERIIRRNIREEEVDVREVDATKKKIKVVTPVAEQDNVRMNANRVVNTVIAPAFAEKRRDFKGPHAQNVNMVNRVFRQENKQPKIRKMDADELIKQANVQREQVDIKRKNLVREKTETVIRVDKDVEKRKKHNPQEQMNQNPNREKDQNQQNEKNKNRDQIEQKPPRDQQNNNDRLSDQEKQQKQKDNRDNQFEHNQQKDQNENERVPQNEKQNQNKDKQKQNREDQYEKPRKPVNPQEEPDRVQPQDHNKPSDQPKQDRDVENSSNQKNRKDQDQVTSDQESKDQPQSQNVKSKKDDKSNKTDKNDKKQKDDSKKKKPDQDEEPNRRR